MEMISGISSGRLQPSAAVSGMEGVSGIQQSAAEMQDRSQSHPLRAVRDEYVPDSNPEVCRCSTDKVDREIEKLKEEYKELEQEIRSETDKIKIRKLESRQKQIERELEQKDTGTYRRQHAVFS